MDIKPYSHHRADPFATLKPRPSEVTLADVVHELQMIRYAVQQLQHMVASAQASSLPPAAEADIALLRPGLVALVGDTVGPGGRPIKARDLLPHAPSKSAKSLGRRLRNCIGKDVGGYVVRKDGESFWRVWRL